MNMALGKELAKYYKEIEKSLLGTKEEKRKILQILKNDVEDFVAEKPDATADMVRERFGDPALFAQESIAYITPNEARSFTRKHKRALIAVGVLAVVVVVTVVLLTAIRSMTPGTIGEGEVQEVPLDSSAVVEVY